MASPQLENGYTPIANELLEAIILYKCSGSQKNLLLFIARATYGFETKESELSLSVMAKGIDKDTGSVSRDLNSLIRNSVIHVTGYNKKTNCRRFKINKNYTEWASNEQLRQLEIDRVEKLLDKFMDDTTQINLFGEEEKPRKDYIDKLLQEFCDAYYESRGQEYVIVNKGKERKAINTLNEAYKKTSKKNTDDAIKDFRDFFNYCMQIQDRWHYLNMSPSHIISQFNQIVSKIKELRRYGTNRTTGTTTKPKGVATEERIQQMLNRSLNNNP